MRTRHGLAFVVVAAALAACRSSASFDAGAEGDLLRTGTDPGALLTALRDANQRFATSPDAQVLGERTRLAAKQSPPVAVLACADSRCAPEWVFEQRPGRLFVVRMAGNVADTEAIASFEYAVAHLGTHLIVVLGHEHCGAVAAAVAGKDPGTEPLRQLVARIEPAVAAHRGTAEGDALLHAAIEENARRGAARLSVNSPVLARAIEGGTLRIVAAVHDLDSGAVRFLEP